MGKDNELLQAVREGDLCTVQKLLTKHRASKTKLIGSSKRLNVNQQTEDGMSPLHQAALTGNIELLTLLLEHEALVDIKDIKGMRPLHYAAWQGKEDHAALLLRQGAAVNEQALDGNTPLHLACEHGHLAVVDQLLKEGADPSLENNHHRTPLDAACEFGRCSVVELLLTSAQCRQGLLSNPQDLTDSERTTCLHLAAKNGHVEIVRLLLQAGMDINRQTLQGTCLHEAAVFGKVEVVRLLLSVSGSHSFFLRLRSIS
jgi:ankyrin repeat protein